MIQIFTCPLVATLQNITNTEEMLVSLPSICGWYSGLSELGGKLWLLRKRGLKGCG